MPLLVLLFDIVHHVKCLRRDHTLPIVEECFNLAEIVSGKPVLFLKVLCFGIHSINDLLVFSREIRIYNVDSLIAGCYRRTHVLSFINLIVCQTIKNFVLFFD